MLKNYHCTVVTFLTLFLLSICSCKQASLLSPSEKAWLKKQDTIKVAVFPYYPPYHFKGKTGKVQGILIDYLSLIENKIGYKFKRVAYNDFSQVLEDAQEDELDIILEIQNTESRESYLNFYSSLFHSPFVLVGTDDAYKVMLNDIYDKSVAVPKDFAIHEYLETKYPELNLITSAISDLEALKQVHNGTADYYIGPQSVANYFIKTEKLENLKVISEINKDYAPSLAVNKDNALLNTIIYKASGAITQSEQQRILNNWLFEVNEPYFKRTSFWAYMVGILALIIVTILLINNILRHKVLRRTRQLTLAKAKAEESSLLKTSFINNISHEMRTPMNAIMGFAGLLNKSDISDTDRSEYLELISDGCVRLMEMIDNVLEVSLLQTNQVPSQKRNTDLNALLTKCFKKYQKAAENKGLEFLLVNTLDDQHQVIYTDRIKVSRIIHFLLDNAIKFTTEGSVKVTVFKEDNDIKITIQDTGIGISTENQKSIFDSYSKSNKDNTELYEGLGLGLTISKAYCELINGELELDSKLGQGTLFTLSFPAIPALDINNDPRNSIAIKSKDDGYAILIAEDGEVNYLFLRTLLKRISDYNITVYRAKNGQEAVDIINSGDHIDLVFMDIQMPIMNGYKATQVIKQLKPKLPVIAQTAYTTQEDIHNALKAGCDDFIAKPVDPGAITAVVTRFLK